jgi:hypothetical protein
LQKFYLRHRYDVVSATSITGWADSVHHARLGVSGAILSYPLYGSDLTNDVSFLSTTGSWGTHSPITSCPARRENIDNHHYQPSSPAQWIDRSVTRTAFFGLGVDAIGVQRLTVNSVSGRMNPSTCSRQ